MEPVVCAPEDACALTEEDLPIVFEQYERLAELMIKRRKEGRPFTFYHYMLDLAGGPCIYKRISGCGSGTEYMAVTPWGDLYPCHQFVGDEKFRLGNIWTGVTNTKPCAMEFAACNVYARPGVPRTAGPGCIAPAAAPQMRITPRVPLQRHLRIRLRRCSAKGWNAR